MKLGILHVSRQWIIGLLVLLAGPALFPAIGHAQPYSVYVACESDDAVALVTFDGEKARVAETINVGVFPTETEGPHGITIAPDGKHWFVTVAHGQPFGHLYKFRTDNNEFVERVELGMFPASMEISPATGLLYAVNFNLHGDLEPSTVSVVDPAAMEVVAEIPTGIMPHGSRISADGRRAYHVSMMTDELVEVNTVSLEVSRRLNIASTGPSDSTSAPPPQAKPTWADPHPSRPLVYVANNGSDEVVEVNTESWKVTRHFSTGSGPYNLEVTDDGKKLVVSYKGDGTTGIWDLESGRELARISNSRSVTHGIVTSPDSRYAFISAEGEGGEPGAVDVIDLETLERTATVDVGKQAGGIGFWKKKSF